MLAAFQPNPELLRRQLLSLRAQTVAEWDCIITVDGDPGPIAALVAEIVPADDRFRVIGDGTRLGFYLNFERGLLAVSPNPQWIALSDQDDRWDDHKLERLIPHLDDVSLVSGQARLVTYPEGVITGQTTRAPASPELILLSNQFTGSLCVFDAELLVTALPFPRASTRAATHDHWLAVVAGQSRGTRIVNEALQDYVQHAGNVFGDPSRLGKATISKSFANALDLAKRYEGGRSPAAIARAAFWIYVGWRQLMVDTLNVRTMNRGDVANLRNGAFSADRSYFVLHAVLRQAVGDGFVPSRFRWEYRISWLAGILLGGRRRVSNIVRQDAALSAR